MRLGLLMLVLAASAPAAAGRAAEHPDTVPAESCAAPAPPPPGMAGWSRPTPLPAARREADLDRAALPLGKAITAAFAPVAEVRYRTPPETADGPATFGGLYALTVAEPGVYRIAAAAAPWIDVFSGDTPAKPVRFGRGPQCSGIGKMVDFELKPGRYLVQFSESLQPSVEILLTKLPR